MNIQKKSPVADALLAAARMALACLASVIVILGVMYIEQMVLGKASEYSVLWVGSALVAAVLYVLINRRDPFAQDAFSAFRLAPYSLMAGVVAVGYFVRFMIYMIAGGEMGMPLSFSGFAYAITSALFGAMVYDALCVRFLLRRGHEPKTVVTIMAAIALAMSMISLALNASGGMRASVGDVLEVLTSILYAIFTTMLFIKSGGFAGRVQVTAISVIFSVAAPAYAAANITADVVLLAALVFAILKLDKAPWQQEKIA